MKTIELTVFVGNDSILFFNDNMKFFVFNNKIVVSENNNLIYSRDIDLSSLSEEEFFLLSTSTTADLWLIKILQTFSKNNIDNISLGSTYQKIFEY